MRKESAVKGGDYDGGDGGCHISQEGCLRLAKAMRVLLAKKAGWDGVAGYAYGDVSGDGNVSSYDASMAARYAVGLITLSAEQIDKADVTGNTTVSGFDASWIARRAVDPGIVFPVEE